MRSNPHKIMPPVYHCVVSPTNTLNKDDVKIQDLHDLSVISMLDELRQTNPVIDYCIIDAPFIEDVSRFISIKLGSALAQQMYPFRDAGSTKMDHIFSEPSPRLTDQNQLTIADALAYHIYHKSTTLMYRMSTHLRIRKTQFLLALYYFEQFLEKASDFRMELKYFETLLVVSTIIAEKVVSDVPFSMSAWCSAFKIPKHDCRVSEQYFLKSLDYHTYLSSEQFTEFCQKLSF